MVIKNIYTGKTIMKIGTLVCADLRGIDLRGTDLRRADLRRANLCNADLRGAKINYPMRCPGSGEYIGYKKCNDNKIVTLLIPAYAKRSSATSGKCRASYVKVVEGDGVTNSHGPETIYKTGEVVYPDSWDDNRWNECSNGIHHFMTREEAENW
jgi:translation initiation factor IF-1